MTILQKITGHKTIQQILQDKNFQKYEKWFLLAFWLIAIYYFSSKRLDFVVLVDWWEYLIRKLAHMFEFAVLAFLFYRILGETEKRHVYWNLFWAFAFTVLYAISDEYHQTFVTGRIGNYKDVLIDSAGASIAIWLLYLDYRHKKSNNRK